MSTWKLFDTGAVRRLDPHQIIGAPGEARQRLKRDLAELKVDIDRLIPHTKPRWELHLELQFLVASNDSMSMDSRRVHRSALLGLRIQGDRLGHVGKRPILSFQADWLHRREVHRRDYKDGNNSSGPRCQEWTLRWQVHQGGYVGPRSSSPLFQDDDQQVIKELETFSYWTDGSMMVLLNGIIPIPPIDRVKWRRTSDDVKAAVKEHKALLGSILADISVILLGKNVEDILEPWQDLGLPRVAFLRKVTCNAKIGEDMEALVLDVFAGNISNQLMMTASIGCWKEAIRALAVEANARGIQELHVFSKSNEDFTIKTLSIATMSRTSARASYVCPELDPASIVFIPGGIALCRVLSANQGQSLIDDHGLREDKVKAFRDATIFRAAAFVGYLSGCSSSSCPPVNGINLDLRGRLDLVDSMPRLRDEKSTESTVRSLTKGGVGFARRIAWNLEQMPQMIHFNYRHRRDEGQLQEGNVVRSRYYLEQDEETGDLQLVMVVDKVVAEGKTHALAIRKMNLRSCLARAPGADAIILQQQPELKAVVMETAKSCLTTLVKESQLVKGDDGQIGVLHLPRLQE